MPITAHRITLFIRTKSVLAPARWDWEDLVQTDHVAGECVEVTSAMRGQHLAEFPIPGNGIQAPGKMVLRDLTGNSAIEGTGDRYAVHFFNEQDGGYHNGYYFDNSPAGLALAWGEFGRHCAQSADYLERLRTTPEEQL